MTANCRSRNIASLLVVALAAPAFAQAPKPAASQASAPATPVVAAGTPAAELPPDYVIGPDDILGIVYWKDKDMTTDAHVRPDGRIALPLLNDVHAAGLTPEQLREKLTEEFLKLVLHHVLRAVDYLHSEAKLVHTGSCHLVSHASSSSRH